MPLLPGTTVLFSQGLQLKDEDEAHLHDGGSWSFALFKVYYLQYQSHVENSCTATLRNVPEQVSGYHNLAELAIKLTITDVNFCIVFCVKIILFQKDMKG